MHAHACNALKTHDYSWLQNSAPNSLPKNLTHTEKSTLHHLPHMGRGGGKHRSYRRPWSRFKIDSGFRLSPVPSRKPLCCQTRASAQRSTYAEAEKGHCKARTCPAIFLIDAGKRCWFAPQKHRASAHLPSSTAQVTQACPVLSFQ